MQQDLQHSLIHGSQASSMYLCANAAQLCLLQLVMLLLQIPAEKCQQLESAKEHKGKSEPLFLMYRVCTVILSNTILVMCHCWAQQQLIRHAVT